MAPRGEPPNQSKAAKKRSYASRTPQARSYKTPGRTTEAGVTAASVAKIVQQVVKQVTKGKSKPSASEIKSSTNDAIAKWNAPLKPKTPRPKSAGTSKSPARPRSKPAPQQKRGPKSMSDDERRARLKAAELASRSGRKPSTGRMKPR